MSVTSLVPSFTDVATNLGSTIFAGASEAAMGAVTGWAVATYAIWRAKRAMNKNDYSDDETYIKEFFFERTKEVNPETGNHIHIFKLRPHEQINLENVFGKSIRSEAAKRIIAASEECTTDKPVVFEFLKSVYDRPKLLQRIINVSSWLSQKLNPEQKVNLLIDNVDEHWTNFFGAFATPNQTMLRNVPKDTAPFESTRYPILVSESDPKKRFHIFWLNEDQLDPSYYPDPRDIKLDKESEASYLPLIRAMVDQMAEPENAFIRDICRVPIPSEDVKYVGYTGPGKPKLA